MLNAIRADIIDRIIRLNHLIDNQERRIAEIRRTGSIGIKPFSLMIDELEKLMSQKQELVQRL